MPEKTAAEKLRLRPGMSAALMYLPDGMRSRLGIPADVTIVDDPSGADLLLVFASTQAEAEERLTALAPSVRGRTITWIAYPKGSKAAGHDVSRDTIAAFAPAVGLVAVASVSIDGTWSGLRVRPL
jgi:hypothetical protein